MSEGREVSLWIPGRRARRATQAILALAIISIMITSTTFPYFPNIVNVFFAGPSSDNLQKQSPNSTPSPPQSSELPQLIGADGVPDLSLPHTVLSSVDNLIGEGGVLQTSPDNLTLYNLAISLRLLGGVLPHDELLDPSRRVISSYFFWGVEVMIGNRWFPLLPSSSQFLMLGTNSSGTFVLRTMNLTLSSYLGQLRIVYKATSKGPVKWNLDFTAGTSGHFRLAYSWWNVSDVYQLLNSTRQFTVGYRSANYTFSWNDVKNTFNTSESILPGRFSLAIDLGSLSQNSRVVIDPSIISSYVAPYATAYDFQRKVFYEPKWGNYWVFYFDGSCMGYRYSHDGIHWSNETLLPASPPQFYACPTITGEPPGVYLKSIYNVGQSLIVGSGQQVSAYTGTASVSLSYYTGTIYANNTIGWGSLNIIDTISRTCTSTCTIVIQDVSATLGTTAYLGFSYNWAADGSGYTTGSTVCTSNTVNSESGSFTYYAGNRVRNSCNSGGSGLFFEEDRSIILNSNSAGQVRTIYEYHNGSRWQMNARWQDTLGYASPIEIVDANYWHDPNDYMGNNAEFSATSDASYTTHLVYKGINGNLTYAYRPAAGPWGYTKDIFQGSIAYPTLTADYSTNDLYAFSINGTSIAMRIKHAGGSWMDSSIAYPVTQRVNPKYLVSNILSSSFTSSGNLTLIWTEGYGPFNATFASIPIQTVWSPYSSPSDPWDGKGLAPYGQYFANLGEYVSPSSGMLTVRQTDLSVTGRGIDLELTRVYTEPYSFLASEPYLYEKYPWAPMGNGWQLNFPWMNNVTKPSFIHLSDGQGYRIPISFWNSATAVFENHQGGQFRMAKNSTGIYLTMKTGLTYRFDNSTSELTKIMDSSGNTITMAYNATTRHISTITDTVSRTFLFCYSGGLLHSINQTSGNCQSSAGNLRGLVFVYNGSSLNSVKDPIGRATNYTYTAVSSTSARPWLLSRITYPTAGYSNYTYFAVTLGTQATSYRVRLQTVYQATNAPTRQFSYTYSQSGGDQITNSTVQAYDGSSGSLKTVSYTHYAFSFAGTTVNTTDASNRLLSGIQQRFGVNGEVPREVVLVTDGSGLTGPGHIGSYTNYYRYDLWGNMIWSRKNINNSTGWYHETFNSYYNNGLPPGFYAFQDTFSQGNYTRPDESWSVQNGYWVVKNGQFNGTETPGFQESMLAWSSLSKTDISVQGRIYLASKINSTDARTGLFTHYPGTGTGKWSLVIHNSTTGVRLSLLDGNGAWITESSCAVTNRNWYTLNLTVSGTFGQGWLSGPAGIYCSVSGYFSGGTFATANGFGLYAGGYSTLFDNVTVTTVSPLITGIRFSDSFYPKGAPGPSLHASMAGKAEFTNSTGTVQLSETYFSYYSWGGLNQTKQLLNQPPVVDGSSQNFCSNTTSSCSTTLNTHSPNDIVILFAFESLDLQHSCTFAISDTATLTWASRSAVIFGRGGKDQLQEFWAKGPNRPFTDTITESISGCGNNYNGLQVFAITGANLSNPFDPNGALPGSGSNNSGGTMASVSTSNLNDIVFATVQHGGTSTPTPQTGFFTIWAAPGGASEYQPQNSLLTNFPVTFGDSTTDYWEEIADAVQAIAPTQWLSSSNQYDVYGNLKISTDAKGYTTYYTYSGNYTYAYLTNQTRLDGSTRVTTLYAYNFTTGNVRIVADPMGNATSYNNDNLGRVTRISYPLGAFTQYSYNDKANYVDIANENNMKTRQIYDGLGRLTTLDRFLNGASYSNQTYAYNWQNKQVNQTDSLGNVYRYGYDALGRMVNATQPNGLTTYQFYNDFSSWVRSQDQDGNYKCNIYDRLGRLVSVVEKASSNCQSGIVTNYTYDEIGNLLRATNAYSMSTNYNYDSLSRLMNTVYADNYSETYTYDNNGNVANSTDRKGYKTMRSYDSLNRLKTITYCGASSSSITGTSYTYDRNSSVLQSQNENDTIYYTYDARNRVLTEKSQVNLANRQVVDLGCFGSGGTITRNGGSNKTYTVTYTYNGEFLATLTYPTIITTNIGVSYAYDGLGRVLNLTQVGSPSTYLAKSFTYYKNDQVKGLQYGNGLMGNYTYDSLARPSTITLKNGGTTLLSLTYGYNNTGAVSSVTGQVNSANVNEQYRYDALQRLTNATVTSQGTTTTLWYQYDNVGNRLMQSLNGIITRYNYTYSNNRLTNSTSTSNPNTKTTYSYDPNGNLLGQNVTASGATKWQYTWDNANHLLKVTSNGLMQGTYAYDGTGRKIESIECTSCSDIWFYAYRGTETLWQTNANWGSIDFLTASGMKVATVDSSVGNCFCTTKYYQLDRLNSTRLVTSASKSVTFSDGYQPFGQDNGTPNTSENYKFTGKPYSSTTGLYYYYQRWYDPSIGRFISRDPVGGTNLNPQSFNPYVYVVNSPCTHTDASGECLSIYTIGESVVGLVLNYLGIREATWTIKMLNPWIDAASEIDLVRQFVMDYGPQTVQYFGGGMANLNINGYIQNVVTPAFVSLASKAIIEDLPVALLGLMAKFGEHSIGVGEAEDAIAAGLFVYSLLQPLSDGGVCPNFWTEPPELFQASGGIIPFASGPADKRSRLLERDADPATLWA